MARLQEEKRSAKNRRREKPFLCLFCCERQRWSIAQLNSRMRKVVGIAAETTELQGQRKRLWVEQGSTAKTRKPIGRYRHGIVGQGLREFGQNWGCRERPAKAGRASTLSDGSS
ncbi:hypothetical protein CDL15_Pgr004487 [Punica granatum]|uniref:Uncharacterized protein n=1 Tax=Punica granatum TaxID=22663 RepID=A0A218WDE5_PUNGR|nr:hypothetical protein CDL15_Pgr004487 [Punica granatum]PKI61376.1 hypothetical protein CRG98_018224 [Punica granatum]